MNKVRKWYAKVVHYLIMTLNALQGSEKKNLQGAIITEIA